MRFLPALLLALFTLLSSSIQAQGPGGGGTVQGGVTLPGSGGKGAGPQANANAVCGARPNEIIETPEVNCERDPELLNRVDQYFNYQPPDDNKTALTQYAGQHVNITKERGNNRPRQPVKTPYTDCDAIPNNAPINEPCQDNRWRDACLVGVDRPDADYALAELPLGDNEDQANGVPGAKPFYRSRDKQINCMVPKNTERLSPLSDLNQGWLYRHSCPGDPQMERVIGDRTQQAINLFRGATREDGQALFNCWAPLPKCDLKNDWLLDWGLSPDKISARIDWVGRTYGKYVDLFAPGLTDPVSNKITGFLRGLMPTSFVSTLERLLSRFTSEDQRKAFIDTMKSDLLNPRVSRAPECKPAYWVRLMLDSCANQFILQNAASPTHIFNPIGRPAGLSMSACQPLRTVDALDPGYFPYEILLPATIGLLHEDYMPYVKRPRFKKPGYDEQWMANMEAQGFPPGMIQGLRLNTPVAGGGNSPASNANALLGNSLSSGMAEALGGFGGGTAANRGALVQTYERMGRSSINQYAGTHVERILDASHPMSPRYDVAETLDGEVITDRMLFAGETESGAARNAQTQISGFPCQATTPGEGYFEFGETVYCSAVNVDLLRFRYEDYRICMGCQIEANNKAFWQEVRINTDYYREQRCGTKEPTYVESNYTDCPYGGELCGSCAKFNEYTTKCTLGDASACTQATKYSLICTQCTMSAPNEALEGARQRNNAKPEPAFGPTAVGANWPVCSTRFDHKGDPDKCIDAKVQLTNNCRNSMMSAINQDPHVKQENKFSVATRCALEKNIDHICEDVAEPVVAMNILKMRIDKGYVATEQPQVFTTKRWNGTQSTFPQKLEQYNNMKFDRPAEGLSFRKYFGNHRPYMRLWDTGQEAMQMDPLKPDYWCDFAANTTVVGVGREWNSIHGAKSQLCRYGGGGGVGDDCFEMQRWEQEHPDLAGSSWTELKAQQMRCKRRFGLNCLCSQEKIFKDLGAEDYVLKAMGGSTNAQRNLGKAVIPDIANSANSGTSNQGLSDKLMKQLVDINVPLSWRGYINTPANRDDLTTSPVISPNQQFPYLYGLEGENEGAGLGTPPTQQPGSALSNVSGQSSANLRSNILAELKRMGPERMRNELQKILPRTSEAELQQRYQSILQRMPKQQLEREMANLSGFSSRETLGKELETLVGRFSEEQLRQQASNLPASLSEAELKAELTRLTNGRNPQENREKLESLVLSLSPAQNKQLYGQMMSQMERGELQQWMTSSILPSTGTAQKSHLLGGMYRQLDPAIAAQRLEGEILNMGRRELTRWISSMAQGVDPNQLSQQTEQSLRQQAASLIPQMNHGQVITALQNELTRQQSSELEAEINRLSGSLSQPQLQQAIGGIVPSLGQSQLSSGVRGFLQNVQDPQQLRNMTQAIIPVMNQTQAENGLRNILAQMPRSELQNTVRGLIGNLSKPAMERAFNSAIPAMSQQELLQRSQTIAASLNKSQTLGRVSNLLSLLSPQEVEQWLAQALNQLSRQELENLARSTLSSLSGNTDVIIRNKGLSWARVGDIIFWPPEDVPKTLPRVAIVRAAKNQETDGGNLAADAPQYVRVQEMNYGKLPDACGNTDMLGYATEQTIYPSVDAMMKSPNSNFFELLKQQVVSTFSCDDPSLRYCVDEKWDKAVIFRPANMRGREPQIGTYATTGP